MNLKDQLWIIKSRLLEKRNLLFMLVLFFVFIVIIISLTFYNCAKFINYSDIVKPNSRNIYIEIDNPSEESLKQINQIPHVIFAISGQTYQTGFFNNKSSNSIYITPLIEKEEITLIITTIRITLTEIITDLTIEMLIIMIDMEKDH